MKIIKNCLMDEYTSFKVGGPADRLVIVETVEELSDILHEISEKNQKYLVIGNGSNTLFTDNGFKGTVIKLGEGFSKMTVEGEQITAGAATLVSSLARFALEKSLGGFEPLSGIPGSIGGGVFMNAGAYGGEMKHVVTKVYAMQPDGSSAGWVEGEDLQLGYRTSRFKKTKEIVLQVVINLQKKDFNEIKMQMDDYTERRNSKQPLDMPSCGSFFKRPEGHFAGALIQNSGLAGFSIGGAQVSEKHCGFLINKGNATATDVLTLKNHIQKTVKEKFGVELEPEVRIIE